MKKERTFVIDKMYRTDRTKGYIPAEHLTIIDEIRDEFKRCRIVIQNITEVKSFLILGKRVRSKKDYEELQKAIDENKNQPIKIERRPNKKSYS